MFSRKLIALVLAVAILAVACAGRMSSDEPSGSMGPTPITEAETGKIIGEPLEVDAFTVDVTDEGTAVFVVSGSVLSECHEAMFGFEEADADGVMVGESESWLDPACHAPQEPTEFTESMEIENLPPGEYLARLDGEFEARFLIPEATPTTTAPGGTRHPSSFSPLGQAECQPASPFLPWPEDSSPGGLAEIRATSSEVDVWGLLWQTPPLAVGEEIKMVWRVTGQGDFNIHATQRDVEAELISGPNFHHDSNFDRPGDEWGTTFIFPSPGCWSIEITRGTDTAYVWVQTTE